MAGLRKKKYYDNVSLKREQRVETRTNCQAKLCLYFDKSATIWRVMNLFDEDNHDLVPQYMVHLIPNHRQLTDANKAQADIMHMYSVKTSQIMWFMAGQAGGYARAGVTKKDLDNHFDKSRRLGILGGDANATISYIFGKADVDLMAMSRYNSTPKDRLGSLFWADGICRAYYQYFGDVLAFDATYKKNKYKKPLKNATLRIKDPSLCESFKKFIYTKWDVDEFEEEWSKLVEEFGGSDTSWIDKQYENKESWARAFLRDKFYVGFRTTLRCEGINNFIKRFVHSRHSILELVENLERALRDYHNNEMVAQFKTINSDHVLTTGLQSLELCVANIYTREIFKLVRKKI
ncbi:protein FAR1-RELATED SEQUENCE 5-like [Arachis hypogaea]|uniref:protein FAR1-RELATED SEQUENCE 5-like n=1 Tax=Arachis hypogaea TaxID=3818 RepID=UPI0007AF5CB1